MVRQSKKKTKLPNGCYWQLNAFICHQIFKPLIRFFVKYLPPSHRVYSTINVSGSSHWLIMISANQLKLVTALSMHVVTKALCSTQLIDTFLNCQRHFCGICLCEKHMHTYTSKHDIGVINVDWYFGPIDFLSHSSIGSLLNYLVGVRYMFSRSAVPRASIWNAVCRMAAVSFRHKLFEIYISMLYHTKTPSKLVFHNQMIVLDMTKYGQGLSSTAAQSKQGSHRFHLGGDVKE